MLTDERLTWKQIREAFPQQWVVLIEHERHAHDAAGFKTARVLAVGASRSEATQRGRPELAAIRDWGCHFTGPLRGPLLGCRPRFRP